MHDNPYQPPEPITIAVANEPPAWKPEKWKLVRTGAWAFLWPLVVLEDIGSSLFQLIDLTSKLIEQFDIATLFDFSLRIFVLAFFTWWTIRCWYYVVRSAVWLVWGSRREAAPSADGTLP